MSPRTVQLKEDRSLHSEEFLLTGGAAKFSYRHGARREKRDKINSTVDSFNRIEIPQDHSVRRTQKLKKEISQRQLY